jgi:hypothetical protein
MLKLLKQNSSEEQVAEVVETFESDWKVDLDHYELYLSSEQCMYSENLS